MEHLNLAYQRDILQALYSTVQWPKRKYVKSEQ